MYNDREAIIVATMIPADIHAFTTEGEGIFYRFLQACAKPDVRYIAWYQPNIAGHEPDFILYAQDAGLIIFEVKDWAIDQIIEGTPQRFLLLMEAVRRSGRIPSSRRGPILT